MGGVKLKETGDRKSILLSALHLVIDVRVMIKRILEIR